jgi:hypothetical protein
MSQSQLAKDLSNIGFETFHQTTIKRIEQGTQSPKLSEALALCFVLGVTLEDSLVTEDVEFLQESDRVEVTRRPPVELGDQLAVEQRLNSLAKTLANQLEQLEVMQRQTRRHLEELQRIGDADRHEATHAERERLAIEGLARDGFGLDRIAELLNLPVAHIRATLGIAEPAEQEAARDHKAESEQEVRDRLSREVGSLRAFEREYRQRLEDWLLELGDAAAFRDYSEAKEIIEEGLRELPSDHRIETSDG